MLYVWYDGIMDDYDSWTAGKLTTEKDSRVGSMWLITIWKNYDEHLTGDIGYCTTRQTLERVLNI